MTVSLFNRGFAASLDKIARVFFWVSVLLILSAAADTVFASNMNQSSDMPWGEALQKIMDQLTGPVATAIVIIGLAVLGGAAIFQGGEITGTMKMLIGVLLLAAIMIGGKKFMGWIQGASIPADMILPAVN